MSVPETNVFGPATLGYEVENAALTTLKLWMPTYIHELERRTGRTPGSIAPLKTWTTVNQFDQQQGDQLPALILVSPGVATAEKHGNGVYAGWWLLTAGLLVNTTDRVSSNELAKLYGAAARLIFVQKASLGGFAQGFKFADEDYTSVASDYLPVGALVLVTVEFLVDGLAQSGRGPAEPDQDADLGEVQEVDIDGRIAAGDNTYDPAPIPLVRRHA